MLGMPRKKAKAQEPPTAAKATTKARSKAVSKKPKAAAKSTKTATPSKAPKKAAKPKVVTTLTHDQIAAKAYEVWVAKGRPDGQEQTNWREAERLLQGQPSD
jgi:hypothetical protein